MCKPNTFAYIWLDGELTPIDACIAPLIMQLNQFGIKTIQSCCGHGKGYPNVICEKNTEEKLEKFGCKIVVTRKDNLVHAFFPTTCLSGKVYAGKE